MALAAAATPDAAGEETHPRTWGARETTRLTAAAATSRWQGVPHPPEADGSGKRATKPTARRSSDAAAWDAPLFEYESSRATDTRPAMAQSSLSVAPKTLSLCTFSFERVYFPWTLV